MKIEAIHVEAVGYRLRSPIETSLRNLSHRNGLRVVARDASGIVGVGEALPLPTSGTEELACTAERLESIASQLPGCSGTLDELLDRVDAGLLDAPSARFALDTALHDLEARRLEIPVLRLLGEPVGRSVPVNAVLGAQPIDRTIAEARQATARGHTTLKLKVGSAEPREDTARIAALRRVLGPHPRVRIDANGAWQPEIALEFLESVKEFDLELVEQPVPADDLEGLSWVAARSPIPVAVDEGLAVPRIREAVLAQGIGSVVVIKPMVAGGLRASSRLARTAREKRLRVLVTTTFEGPVGTAAALHLAAVFGDPGLAHGLASADVVDTAFPRSLIPRGGELRSPTDAGLGP